MAHKEHTPSNSNGGAGGFSLSKKSKNNKLPQRGMGVAQLEKLISSEHQKDDVAILTPKSTNCKPPSSIPIPPPLPPTYRRSLVPITDAANPGFVSNPTHTISNGGNPWGRLWSGGDYQYEPAIPIPNPNLTQNQNQNQNRPVDRRAYAASIPKDLSGLRPFPVTSRQRSHLYQQPCSSSTMELPSNQSYCSNNYRPMWPHEEKVGMKRPYPFSRENMPIPSFKFKIPPLSRSHDTASSSHGCSTGLELTTPVFRENPSSLVTKDFLTLGPLRSSPKEKSAPLSIREATLPQDQGQSQIKDPSGSDWSNRKRLYSFFPVAKNNGEEGDHVDLNLKL